MRAPESIAARLLTAPVLVLAVLLYPSELGDGTLRQAWRNTFNPVTRKPWSSQQEYDEFWQAPLHERERRIQGMLGKSERVVEPLGPPGTLVAPGSSKIHEDFTNKNNFAEIWRTGETHPPARLLRRSLLKDLSALADSHSGPLLKDIETRFSNEPALLQYIAAKWQELRALAKLLDPPGKGDRGAEGA